jgi:hypothetical protein
MNHLTPRESSGNKCHGIFCRGSGGNDFNSPLYDSERVSQRASASEFVGARSSEQQVPGPPPLKPHAKTSSVESDPISPPPRALEKQPSLI